MEIQRGHSLSLRRRGRIDSSVLLASRGWGQAGLRRGRLGDMKVETWPMVSMGVNGHHGQHARRAVEAEPQAEREVLSCELSMVVTYVHHCKRRSDAMTTRALSRARLLDGAAGQAVL